MRWALVFWFVAATLAGHGLTLAAQPASRPYDIMVMVLANGPRPADLVVSYPNVVDHVVLRSAIQQLGKGAGFTPSQLTIRDAPLAQQVSTIGTDAQFKASGLVNSSGRLPVGAIIRSLPQWEHMRLVFILDPKYPFVGPTDVTAEGFAVRLVNRVATYEYDVERISGRAAPGEATATGGAARGGSAGPGERDGKVAQAPPSLVHQVLPAALIALPSGLLVGWLLFGWREKRWRRRPAAMRAVGAQAAASTAESKSSGHGANPGDPL